MRTLRRELVGGASTGYLYGKNQRKRPPYTVNDCTTATDLIADDVRRLYLGKTTSIPPSDAKSILLLLESTTPREHVSTAVHSATKSRASTS